MNFVNEMGRIESYWKLTFLKFKLQFTNHLAFIIKVKCDVIQAMISGSKSWFDAKQSYSLLIDKVLHRIK